MNTDVASAIGQSAARLLIHADDAFVPRGGQFDRPLQRLRAMYSDGPWHDERLPLRLHIDDLQGLRMLSIDDAGPLIEVPLPAGTYHVTVQFGKLHRAYTMTLEQGAAFDLYLRLAPR